MAKNYDKPSLDTSDDTVPVITVPVVTYQPVTPKPKPQFEAKGGFAGFDSTKQTTTNTQISDSYNTSTSNVSSTSVGDSTLSLGNQGGSATDTVALVVGAIALLGGLYLFTR